MGEWATADGQVVEAAGTDTASSGVTAVTTGSTNTKGAYTQLIASTWSNIIGILLTNAFSIIGTIMGVKYASEMKK